MVALKRAGIEIKNYYACEIDKHAIEVSKKNYPEIVHLGSVVGLSPPNNIDLLIGGSPCTDLSIAKKDRKGLEGEQSKLFYEYVRIMKESKPKYFILENVNSMSKESKAKITEVMGVEPIMINASLVSAQSRKRLFWTNIPVKGLPEDKGILLKDILQPDAEVDERMTSKGKAFCLDANYFKGSSVEHSIEKKVRTQIKLGYIGNGGSNNQGGQAHRVYSPEGKSVTLGSSGAGLIKINGAAIRGNARIKTENGIKAVDKLDVRKDEKANSLTGTFHNKLALVSDESTIRKLTPIECERLQGLPDNYTEGIPNTQRYKCLGNAFNVDVIVHIIKYM
jgi:DNA (cytosine-5)-methyltransferase 3A